MNVSAILVIVPGARLDALLVDLESLPGVEVHHVDRPTGRCVITQEAGSIGDEVEGLKRIKALPGVAMAEMVYHYFGDDEEILEGIPPELEEEGGLARVPAFLED